MVCQRSPVPFRRAAALSRSRVRALSVLALLLLGLGCAKQAEGERCDQNNGDLDCESGLLCVGEEQISITGTGFALCCPVTNPTVDACRANTGLAPEADAGLPPLPPPTPVSDAGSTPAPVVTPDASVAAGDGGT